MKPACYSNIVGGNSHRNKMEQKNELNPKEEIYEDFSYNTEVYKFFNFENNVYDSIVDLNLEEVHTIVENQRKNSLLEYLLILACFFTNFTLFGFLNNIVTVKEYWIIYFIEKHWLIDIVVSLNFGLIYISSIFGIYLIDFLGVGQTFTIGSFMISISLATVAAYPHFITFLLFYGIFIGIGASLVLFSILFSIKDIFSENLSIVNSVICCGSCVGSMVQSLFISNLCNVYGWNNVFKLFSLLTTLMASFGMMMYVTCKKRKVNKNIVLKNDDFNEKSLTYLVTRNRKFVMLCCASFVFCLGYPTMYFFIHKLYRTKDLEYQKVGYLIGYVSMGSLFGRLFFGFVSNYVRDLKINILTFCFFGMGILNILTNYCLSYISLVEYCLIFGLFDGGFSSLSFPIICDMFSISEHGQVYENKVKIIEEKEEERTATILYYLIQGVSMLFVPLISNVLENMVGVGQLFTISGILMINSSMILALLSFA